MATRAVSRTVNLLRNLPVPGSVIVDNRGEERLQNPNSLGRLSSMKRFLLRSIVAVGFFGGVFACASHQAATAPEAPVKIAEGIWFQNNTADIGKFGSNVWWIEFTDYVVVIDTAFPFGAEHAIRNIKETTKNKPIRYAILTHYHADHSFGTGVFAKEGATIVAHENARRDYLARNVSAFAKSAEKDPIYQKYQAYAPTLTFTDQFILDDGKRRAEIHYFGHAHTTGCIFTWLPKEKIVFTGDACVNGPYNYMGDADSASWIDVLSHVETLGAETVCPGHGSAGKGDLVRTQRRYFLELRAQVAKLIQEGKSLDEVKKSVDIPMWKAWTGAKEMNVENITHVYEELTHGTLGWEGDPGRTAPAVVAIPMEAGKEKPKLRFLAGKLAPEELAGLQKAAPNVEIVQANSPEEALSLAPGVQGAAGSFVTPEFLAQAKELRWVQQFSAGVEQIVFLPGLRDNDRIVLTNMKRMFAPPIADHVMAMLLSLHRSLPHYQDLMKGGTWGKGQEAPYQGELQGKTMLVVGLGGNGMETAKRARAFGMRVVAVDPKEMAVPVYVERLEKPDRLNALLPAADVVVLASPLTPETKGLFGTAQFSLMKEGSFYISIARGKETDTEALLAALKSKRLQGAGLDVTDPEPLPASHDLWKQANVVITPHVSGQSPGTRQRTRGLFVENMRRFASGEPLLNVVDKKVGY
jgi:phosphoglycerate dehydrogenase-like enzyme/glyoxylase-like metal-dependent hydrolase (beta-lactamase superfamily II)